MVLEEITLKKEEMWRWLLTCNRVNHVPKGNNTPTFKLKARKRNQGKGFFERLQTIDRLAKAT